MSLTPQDDPNGAESPHRVVVVGPDGQEITTLEGAGAAESSAGAITSLVQQPAKVMRIGSMIKQLLDEVRSAPLSSC